MHYYWSGMMIPLITDTTDSEDAAWVVRCHTDKLRSSRTQLIDTEQLLLEIRTDSTAEQQ